ncbi:MAG: restriction endonuclease subunit S [Methylobacter sp.]|uniref:restriction endonuclease subunit S n=1 Tax=Methylobacter sp. TaxID=2051955 RepID=UPI0027315051|nr:restriction endonuclease subunit S [Methylobacter sp.]MDP1667354.1 restriction endonuclease subunit S [Methylobacter sp.]
MSPADVDLPKGWVVARIGDIAAKGEQRMPVDDEEFIYVDIGSIDRSLKRISEPQKLLGKDAPSRARKVINTGDVLVSLTRPNLNAVALVGQELDYQIASTGFEVIKPITVDSRYIFALVRSKPFIDSISGKVQGALYPAAKSDDVRGHEFFLPPLAEQHHISAKLDELLAQVDILKSRLDTIPKILKRFRQSVLAAAVSGRLTEDWRSDDYISVNLNLSKHNFELLIPKCWRIAALEKSCKILSGNAFKSDKFIGSGIPVIKISNIQYGEFEIKNQQFLPASFLEIHSKFKVEPSDLLMALTRPITNNTLKICRYPDYAEIGLLNQRVCKFTFKNESEKKYFEILFQSDYFKSQVEDNLSETLQPNLSPADLKKFVVAIPDGEEQTEIVKRVEQLLTYADQIEQRVKDAQVRVNHLTHSILAKAFRGELTADWREQNPDLISGENSAEALLARIKEERYRLEHNKVTNRRILKKSGENMKPKGILPIIEALKTAGQPLSSQDLLVQSGYPGDAGTEQLEAFFLDIRTQLNAKAITRNRQGDQEFFSIAE